MKRRFLLGLGLVGATLVAIPATVIAQSAPPDPPATYYGTANGATVGQKVLAIVQDNQGNQTVCGEGEVLEDAGKIVYTVDVVAHTQTPGCGAAGRTIRFYLPSGPGVNARFANESATWSGAGGQERNLTLKELERAGQLPLVASDRPVG